MKPWLELCVYSGLGGGYRNPNNRLASKAQPAMTRGSRTERGSYHPFLGVGPMVKGSTSLSTLA